MQAVKTIAKNTIFLTVAEVINGVLMFFVTVWLARDLGADGYGKLSFALSYVVFFTIPTDMGLNALAIRNIARSREEVNKYVSNIFTLRILLGVGTFVALVVIAQFLGKGEDVKIVIYILGAWTITQVWSNLFQAVFRAFEAMIYEAVLKILQSIIFFGLIFFTINAGAQLTHVALSYLVASIVFTILMALTVYARFARFKPRFDQTFIRHLLRQSWPFALSAVFITIYYYMDSLMLGLMGENKAVGWYNAAYKPIMFITVLNALLIGSAFPTIARLYKSTKDQLEHFLNSYVRLIGIVAVPLAFGGIAVGPNLMRTLFTSEFEQGILAFQILIVTVSIVLINVLYGSTLQACDKQKLYMWIVAVGAGINTLLNLILIPFFSLYGAAVATLATEATVFFMMYTRTNRVLRVPFFVYTIKPLIASLVMFGGLLLLHNLFIVWYILYGIVIYGIALFVIGGIRQQEIQLLKNIFKKTSTPA